MGQQLPVWHTVIGEAHTENDGDKLQSAGGRGSWEFHGLRALFFDSSWLTKRGSLEHSRGPGSRVRLGTGNSFLELFFFFPCKGGISGAVVFPKCRRRARLPLVTLQPQTNGLCPGQPEPWALLGSSACPLTTKLDLGVQT